MKSKSNEVTEAGLKPNLLAKEAADALYDPSEQDDLIARFIEGLRSVTRDGGTKRKAGEKPPWYDDDSHWPAVFSHYRKYLLGEKVDPDSGVNPLWHMSWRVAAEAAKMDGNFPGGPNDMFKENNV